MNDIIIKSKNIPICKVLIIAEDDGMGVIDGQFIPLDGYKNIRQLIKKYTELVSELPIVKADKDRNLSKLREEIKELCLLAYNTKNEKLNFSHIDLRDYSDMLGSEGFGVILYR